MPRPRGRPRHPDLLTPAEWRVAHWVRHGLTNRAIAERFGVSEEAVKFHVANAVGKLGLASETGLFTGVDGKVTAHFELPAGATYESGATLVTPLSQTPIPAEKVTANKNRLIVQFDKADLDNNVPVGEVSLTLVANVLQDGVQRQLTSTATVTVTK